LTPVVNVTTQWPAASTGPVIDIDAAPHVILTSTRRDAQSVAVPVTRMDVGTVPPGGTTPTTDVILVLQAMQTAMSFAKVQRQGHASPKTRARRTP
jgi:hypothetical protein